MLVKPIITEKSTHLAENNQFTFEILPHTNKAAVKQLVQSAFKVTVLKVRIIKKSAQIKKTGKKRLITKTKALKKAIVTLKPGDSIEYFQPKDKKGKKGKKDTKSKKTNK